MSRQWGDGRYEAQSLLGRGGTAEVWRATDRLLHRDVAVKSFVGGSLMGGAEDHARFQVEVHLLARLDHPHIIRVLDTGGADDPGDLWYVMYLADAGSLARPDAAHDPTELRRVGVQIADALAYLHGAGVVHRDVKPSNILLNQGERAYLSDFGVAQLAGATRITRTGLLIGTVAFLAPEQVRGETVRPPADVYALGLVLLERLTGRREYAGPPAEAAMARLVRPPEVPRNLPPGWAELITAMTALAPDARPSAVEVRDYLAGQGDPSAPGQRVPASRASVPRSFAARSPAVAAHAPTGEGTPRTVGRPQRDEARPPRPRTPLPAVAVAVVGGALGGGGLVALLMAGTLMGPPSSAAPDHTPPATNEARTTGAGLPSDAGRQPSAPATNEARTTGAGLPSDAGRQPSAPQRNSLDTTAADPLNRSTLSGPASSPIPFQALTSMTPSDDVDPFSSLLKDLLSGGREHAADKGTGPIDDSPSEEAGEEAGEEAEPQVVQPDDAGTGRGQRKAGGHPDVDSDS